MVRAFRLAPRNKTLSGLPPQRPKNRDTHFAEPPPSPLLLIMIAIGEFTGWGVGDGHLPYLFWQNLTFFYVKFASKLPQ